MHYKIFGQKSDSYWVLPKNPTTMEQIYYQLLYNVMSNEDDNKFYYFILKGLCKNTPYLDVIQICFDNYVNMKELHSLLKAEKIF